MKQTQTEQNNQYFVGEIPRCKNSLGTLKTPKKGVNIFHKPNYCITISLSTFYKTYYFALQKRRFCAVKAAVLRCKRAAFAMSNRN
ncbi:hypothetical protein BWX39_09535 [Prevotella intermedia ATCC 25611 = DSM 20706]|nr:hypothetical protein BWX39_09535 [Prevotella intermedia ATCC 25611 = DSM 20706]